MSKVENNVFPFVDVDIREIFEFAIKTGFESHKKRKGFWRRKQSYQEPKEKEQECWEEVLTEQPIQCSPEENPIEQSSWCQDVGPLMKSIQEQDHENGLMVWEHQHRFQKEGIPQEIETNTQQYQGQKVISKGRMELWQQSHEGERDVTERQSCCLQSEILRGRQKSYSREYLIQQQRQQEIDLTMNKQQDDSQQQKIVPPDLLHANESSAKEAETTKYPNQEEPKVTEKENQLNQIEEEVSQEESHYLGCGEIAPDQIELCQGRNMSPENSHNSEGPNGTEPQVYNKEDLKNKQQEQGKGKSKGFPSFLEEEVVKVTRLWQKWEVNEVVKVMQEHHCSQVEEILKVMHQQYTEEEGFTGAKLQQGSGKELGRLMQSQGRQDHEYFWENQDQCPKDGVISLLYQLKGKLSEVLSAEVQLNRANQKTVQEQSPNKGWSIQRDGVSELFQKEDQEDGDSKILQLEQHKENIPNLTGVTQVLQVVKQQHQCQREAILKVLHQQQVHQEEAIREVIGQQFQVELVLKVMHQKWQHQMEAILKVMDLQQQSQEKAVWRVMKQLGHQGKEDPRKMELDDDYHEKEEVKYGSKFQNTEEPQDQMEVDLRDSLSQHDGGPKGREQGQDLEQESVAFKRKTRQQRRPKHNRNNVSKKTDQQIQDTADQRQELCEEENDKRVLEQNQGEEKKPKKHKRDIPNYFVAIPITNSQILDKIEDVQEIIYNKEPELLKALIPVQTMHITIIVAHLRNEQDVQKAVSALEQSKVRVEELLEGKCLNMTFHGIGQFSNQVIYVKMSGEREQQLLSRIAEAVERSFREMNIDITGSKDFRPHLTFLKLSKAPALRRKGYKKIHSELYKEYEDSPFGTEVFSKIDLCSMHKKKQESGYYHSECTISVAPGSTNVTQRLPTEIEYLEKLCTHISPDSCPEAKTIECCHCISCVAEDDEKPIEHTTSIGAGQEIADSKADVLVSDEVFTIDGEVLL